MNKFNFDFSIVRAGAPIVTLSITGLAFNSVVRSLMGYPEQVDIGFDEQNAVIGVCKHQEGNDKPYLFESRAKDGWIRISCRDFMRYLSIKTGFDFKRAKQFMAEYDPILEMLIIKVDEEHLKRKGISEDEDENN